MGRFKKTSAKRLAMLATKPRVTFTRAMRHFLSGLFVLDKELPVAPETQLANFKAERPMLYASRHVRNKKLAEVRAMPREPKRRRARYYKRHPKIAVPK